jgi:ATP-dependent DNA helicase DinG
LRELADELEDRDLQAELQSVCRRGGDLRHTLDAFLTQGLEDNVYWVEKEGRRRQMVLYSAPVEVGPALEQNLFGSCASVVMTSATLAVHGEMDFFCRRIGAESCRRLSVGSPFDFARQMRVYLAPNMPDPTQAEPFMEAADAAIRHFVARTHGHAFVLFTSARIMRRMADRLAEFMADQGYPLLVQDGSLSRHAMLERFQQEPSSVLFGLDSFWMGVDVRGDALRNVIVMRLPFSVPDHPVIKARTARIKERGGDPFREYSLPEAVLKFRQGVGRLIRTATDEGIVVVLDSRIAKKWYGRLFMEALPDCPVEEVADL